MPMPNSEINMVTIFSFGFLIASGFYFYVFIIIIIIIFNTDFGFNGLPEAFHSKSRQIQK